MPNWLEESGIRRIQPQPSPPPANAPTGTRIPRIFVIPIGAIASAVAVFGIIYFWSDNDAPAWVSEMNPITGQPYSTREEYDEIQRLSPEEIQQRRPAPIKNSQSQPPPAPVPPPAPTLTPEQEREQEKKREQCGKLATKIEDILNAKRPKTPPGGRPQGRKGISERWREIAENKGKWLPQPDGTPSKAMRGHLTAYAGDQKNLVDALKEWDKTQCDDKKHALPPNARQYAAQTPEYGPGKPLEPAPTPEYRSAPIPPIIAPQSRKGSK